MIIQWFYYFLIFLFGIWLAFYVPGGLLLRRLQLKFFERLMLAVVVGIVLWACQGLIFGFLGVRNLSYSYLVVLFLGWFWMGRFRLLKIDNWRKIFKKLDFTFIAIVFAGSLLMLSSVFFMGVRTKNGMIFCCRSVDDAMYHLALTSSLVNYFPPLEPGLPNRTVKNYHFLSDLVVADFARVFKIPFIFLEFQYFSLLLTVMLAGLTLLFSDILSLGRVFARWLAVFVFLAGDILYVLIFLINGNFQFETTVLDDASKLLTSPPRAFSVVLMFGGLCLFILWIKRKDLYTGFLTGLVLGSLIGFKVYTGIFALWGAFFVGLYFLYRSQFKMLPPLIFMAVLSVALFLPFNRNSGGIYYGGLWRFRDFIQTKGVNFSDLELRREIFQNDGKIFKSSVFDASFILLYLLFLFGTTNLAFLNTRRSIASFPVELNIFLIPGLMLSLVIGSLFLQATGGANTVQFINVAFIFGSIYAALALYYWLGKVPKNFGYFLICCVLLLTMFRGISEGFKNIGQVFGDRGFKVSNEELAALDYLNKNTNVDAVVMSTPWISENGEFLYLKFLSGKKLYLGGARILRDHGYDVDKQARIAVDVGNQQDAGRERKLLNESGIDFYYLPTDFFLKLKDRGKVFETVYENGKVSILKYKKD